MCLRKTLFHIFSAFQDILARNPLFAFLQVVAGGEDATASAETAGAVAVACDYEGAAPAEGPATRLGAWEGEDEALPALRAAGFAGVRPTPATYYITAQTKKGEKQCVRHHLGARQGMICTLQVLKRHIPACKAHFASIDPAFHQGCGTRFCCSTPAAGASHRRMPRGARGAFGPSDASPPRSGAVRCSPKPRNPRHFETIGGWRKRV